MQTFTSYSPSDSKDDHEVINLASNNPKKRAGRRKFQETRHPVYRGVRRRNASWVCEVREPRSNSRIWLGTYPTLEMAARAHDVAAIALRGRSACLNFADSAWRLPVPASLSRDDIRKAAAEAAEAFRPQKTEEEDGSPENMQTSSDGHQETSTLMMSSDDAIVNELKPENIEMSSTLMMGDAIANDEALFGMHGLFADMAEGLMLEPPPQYINDDVDIDADVSLWGF